MNTNNIKKLYLKPSVKVVHIEARQMLASSPLSDRVSMPIDEDAEYDGEAE